DAFGMSSSFTSFLQIVENCDNFPYPNSSNFPTELFNAVPLTLNKTKIGILLPSTVDTLREYNSRLNPAPLEIKEKYVTFSAHITNFQERTEAVKQLFDTWRSEKKFAALEGWRDELYPVYGDINYPSNVAFVMERAATPIFGIPTFGVHLNGYIKTPEGKIKMWIAKRASTKPTWPGRLDNTIAGGITYQLSINETIAKEAMEEASIPANIASTAVPTGAITYFTVTKLGLQPETQYIYDLEFPVDIQPKPLDDEVECFYLLDVDEVKKNLLEGKFKPNCALAVIDFFIRHSVITPDKEPDYIEILTRIHRKLEFPGPKTI
ncbi:11367_t:CDS:2, partial [Ambispora gerdemannii]